MKVLDGLGLVLVAAATAGGVVLLSPGRITTRHLDLRYDLPPLLLADYDFGADGNHALREGLEEAFGPHERPHLPPDADPEALGIRADQLLRGRELYVRKCMHCHGANGDGNGPTARFLVPPPRDFSKGVVKFTSTPRALPPTRSDIEATLFRGVAGTAMPSFAAEPAEDRAALGSYVQYLLMRGQTAFLTAFELDDGGECEDYESGDLDYEELQEAVADYLAESFASVQEQWREAPETVIVPETSRPRLDATSVARGRELFLSARLECAACHGETGDGHGPNVYDAATDSYKRTDDWGNPAMPANLNRGLYRGGDRPLDLFRRIHTGIKGSIMPEQASNLSEAEIWDLVNYVYSLRYDVAVEAAN